MKNIKYYGVWLFMLLFLTACGGGSSEEGSGPGANSGSAVRALQLNEEEIGYIDTVGKVDTYYLRADTSDRYLRIYCEEKTSGTTSNPNEVDLVVTVFTENEEGERVRLFGKHELNDSVVSAGLELWILIDQPKDIYITVRDLMDDEAHNIPYFLTASFQDSVDGNHDFSNALELGIGSDPESDYISEIGQVDCFSFRPPSSGIYSLDVIHNVPGGLSAVKLAVSLYDYHGNRIQRVEPPYYTVSEEVGNISHYHYRILAYLEQYVDEQGNIRPYNIAVEDSESMYADESATYDISVTAGPDVEARENDTADDATPIEIDNGVYMAAGSLDYGCSSTSTSNGSAGDADWYQFQISGDEDTFNLMKITIDGGETPTGSTAARVTIYDENMQSVLAYDYLPGSGTYVNQLRVKTGDYYISVVPADPMRLTSSTTYRVRVEEVNLSPDAADAALEASDTNTEDGAVELTLTNGVAERTAYVSYTSDVDWYKVNVGANQVLSVDLQTVDPSIVDFQISIWFDNGAGSSCLKRFSERKLTDAQGNELSTHIKTSKLIEQAGPYLIKVGDAQNNEGSEVPYTLRVSTAPVPTTGDTVNPPPGHVSGTTSGTLYYFGETVEEANLPEANSVQVKINGYDQPKFKANSDWLDFRNQANENITRTPQVDGTTVITFPWICGYIDYQGDRDLFKLDLNMFDLDPENEEDDVDEWYYDVKVRMVVPSADENDVEYVWKLYHDGFGGANQGVIDRDTESDAPDGYFACDGDGNPQATGQELDIETPDGFWVGSDWGEEEHWGGTEGTMFYFAMSDFNYIQVPPATQGGDPTPNTEPDDDWGYEAPYYFKITLTYHPGAPRP